MPFLIDFHLLAQAILYFLSVACGLVVSIPLGVTTGSFHGKCLLYTSCNWKNYSYFIAEYTAGAPCYFPVYLSVFAGILFAAGMGVYYIYAVTRKDPNTGSQMWVLPFVLISSVVSVCFFITACMISVGFKSFCDSFMKGKTDYHNPSIHSCADGQKFSWRDLKDPSKTINGSTFYNFIHTSEVAAWIMFLVWLVQVGLGIVRIIRNRRLRSQGMFADSGGETGTGKTAEDMTNVVAAEPTA